MSTNNFKNLKDINARNARKTRDFHYMETKASVLRRQSRGNSIDGSSSNIPRPRHHTLSPRRENPPKRYTSQDQNLAKTSKVPRRASAEGPKWKPKFERRQSNSGFSNNAGSAGSSLHVSRRESFDVEDLELENDPALNLQEAMCSYTKGTIELLLNYAKLCKLIQTNANMCVITDANRCKELKMIQTDVNGFNSN